VLAKDYLIEINAALYRKCRAGTARPVDQAEGFISLYNVRLISQPYSAYGAPDADN
jgi:hypothetical protein